MFLAILKTDDAMSWDGLPMMLDMQAPNFSEMTDQELIQFALEHLGVENETLRAAAL